MSNILDAIAQSRYAVLTGTTAEAAVVPENCAVTSYSFLANSSGDATLVITPGGAGQKAVALPAITVAASGGFDDQQVLHRLGAGTIFTFAGNIKSYVISISYLGGV